jgi:GYF domain 2
MSGQWYYSHDGVTHGPFSEEEIQDRVAQKLLLENDSVWPAGRDKTNAAPATAVFDFSQASTPVSPIPDWLTDVAAAQTAGPLPGPAPSDETPEWLEDMRLWVGLDLYTPAENEFTYDSTLTGEIPDWLGSWLTPQTPKVPEQAQPPHAAPAPAIPLAVPVSPPPAGAPPTVSAPAQPSIPPSVIVASPVSPARPVAPNVAAPPPIQSSPVFAKAQVPATSPAPIGTPPSAKVPAQAKTKAAPKPASPLVEKTLDASGFDLETGRILDPEKFRKWKQQLSQSSAGQPALSNASLFEVFRKARTAVEAWVDDDVNRACIMKTELEEIRRKPEIQVILHEYANYGKAMQEKLLRHLEFMVDNRRKYYKAIAALRSAR